MSKLKLMFLIVISIIAAVMPLLTIEFIEVLRANKEATFSALDLMIKKVQFSEMSFWAKLKEMRTVLFFMPFIYFILLIIYIPILLLIYLGLSSKFFKPKIFISYKMSLPGDVYKTEPIARELEKKLIGAGFRVYLMDSQYKPHHDVINKTVKKYLRWADAVVAIPHPNATTYLNSEIAIAYYLDKPVYLVKYVADQKLPSNANTGHTVFLYTKLKKNKFNAMYKVLCYAHGTWRSRWEKVFRPVFETVDDISSSFWVMGVVYALSLIYLYFPLSVNVQYLYWGLNILFVSIGTYIWASIFDGIITRTYFQKIVRQSIINEKPTYEMFIQAKFDKDVLSCIDKDGLLI